MDGSLGSQNYIPAKGKPGGQPEPISDFRQWGNLQFPKPPPTAYITHQGLPSGERDLGVFSKDERLTTLNVEPGIIKGKPGGQPKPISDFRQWGNLQFPKPPPSAYITHQGLPSGERDLGVFSEQEMLTIPNVEPEISPYGQHPPIPDEEDFDDDDIIVKDEIEGVKTEVVLVKDEYVEGEEEVREVKDENVEINEEKVEVNEEKVDVEEEEVLVKHEIIDIED